MPRSWQQKISYLVGARFLVHRSLTVVSTWYKVGEKSEAFSIRVIKSWPHLFILVLGIKPRALRMLSMCSGN